MGQRLGINSSFQREDILRHKNNNSVNKLPVNNNRLTGNNPSFNGYLGDKVVQVNQWITGGGFVKSFLVLDTFGFILPRIAQAFVRNKEELGGYNYKAATEEAIREFTSGPGIFAVPFTCILLAKKLIGSATNIDNKTLNVLSDKFESMTQDPKTDFNATKNNFYRQILNDAFKDHLSAKESGIKVNGKTSQGLVEDIFNKILEIEGKQQKLQEKKRFFADFSLINPKMKEIEDQIHGSKKKKIKGLESELEELVINLNNKHGKSLNNKGNILLAVGKDKKVEHNVKTFLSYIFNYSNDIVKNACESQVTDKLDLIKKLNKQAKGGKILLNYIAIILTAAYTYCIPKLYQRSKTYPGTEGLTDKTNASQPSSGKEVAR